MLNRHLLMASLAALLLTGGSVPSVADQLLVDGPIAEITSPGDASITDPDPVMQRRPAPNCIVIDRQEPNDLNARNACSNQQRVKLVIAWGPDSTCYVVSPNTVQWHFHHPVR
jgi:hypothetical protein